MNDLSKIGFYTLSNERANTISKTSDLQRCELILTDRCNFKCPYCRGIKDNLKKDLTLDEAKHIVDLWCDNNLRNIRFSGGEPTIWKDLLELVKYTKSKDCIKHIALSTNGSADFEYYKELYEAGVNDFSISLDSCCSSTASVMSGIDLKFEKIVSNIKELSKLTYVTVGVVLDDKNINELDSIIKYADSLGVSDIRIIPCAQKNRILEVNVEESIINKYPILKYRVNNLKEGNEIRGLKEIDSHKCNLVLDDMVILNNYHFPCIIYMREQGSAIGSISNKTIYDIRDEREHWSKTHDCYNDDICRKNCLDICIEFNNTINDYKIKKQSVIRRLDNYELSNNVKQNEIAVMFIKDNNN